MRIYFCLSIQIAVALFFVATSPVIAEPLDRPEFFQQHRDQFDAEVCRLENQENVCNLDQEVNETALNWSRIVIAHAEFSAQIPPGAITHEVEVIKIPKGELQFDIIATHPSSSRYVVAYSEEVTPERFKNNQEVLSIAQDYIIDNNVGLTEVEEDDITFEQYPGKQFQLQNQDETIIFRLLLIKQRLYVLAVNQHNDAISSKLINTFFDSFKLID